MKTGNMTSDNCEQVLVLVALLVMLLLMMVVVLLAQSALFALPVLVVVGNVFLLVFLHRTEKSEKSTRI